MSSCISGSGKLFFVSNQRLNTLIAFVLQVAATKSGNPEETSWISKLKQFDDGSYPGIDLNLDVMFPSLAEKKFWSECFHEVSDGILSKRLGNHAVNNWQASAICDSENIARLLAGSSTIGDIGE